MSRMFCSYFNPSNKTKSIVVHCFVDIDRTMHLPGHIDSFMRNGNERTETDFAGIVVTTCFHILASTSISYSSVLKSDSRIT